MLKPSFVALSLVVMLGGALEAQTPAPATAPEPKNDYSSDKSWLCRPGRQDACAIDLTTSVVAANGTVTKETWSAASNPAIDCFYVYPTVSSDTTTYSDMNADARELNVVAQQFARFASKCRIFAPLYRQVTVAGLTRGLATGLVAMDKGLGFDDVKDAWHYYLEHDNNGRGVVLVSHSQGSFALIELIRQEIDGKPIESRIVSAIMPGAALPVPKGKTVGGVFAHMPLCTKAGETGCAIAYSAFRSTVPPPANTLFGRVPDAGQAAACVNPAALGGGSGALHAYLSASGSLIVGTAPPTQWSGSATVDTPFVSLPGLLTAECATNENGSFLKIIVNGNPADPRVDDIPGDLRIGPALQANWGLHLVDINLAMGNLLDIVDAQAKAYVAKPRR